MRLRTVAVLGVALLMVAEYPQDSRSFAYRGIRTRYFATTADLPLSSITFFPCILFLRVESFIVVAEIRNCPRRGEALLGEHAQKGSCYRARFGGVSRQC